MKLVPLTIDSPENLILASIFEEVFPPEERISIEDLYRPSQLDGYAVLGVSFHGEIIGFLVLFRCGSQASESKVWLHGIATAARTVSPLYFACRY